MTKVLPKKLITLFGFSEFSSFLKMLYLLYSNIVLALYYSPVRGCVCVHRPAVGCLRRKDCMGIQPFFFIVER